MTEKRDKLSFENKVKLIHDFWHDKSRTRQAEKELAQAKKQVEILRELNKRLIKDITDTRGLVTHLQADLEVTKLNRDHIRKELEDVSQILNKPTTEIGIQTDSDQEKDNLSQELTQLKQKHQSQLKKINLLFDSNSVNYETIEFDGLYSLLATISDNLLTDQEIKWVNAIISREIGRSNLKELKEDIENNKCPNLGKLFDIFISLFPKTTSEKQTETTLTGKQVSEMEAEITKRTEEMVKMRTILDSQKVKVKDLKTEIEELKQKGFPEDKEPNETEKWIIDYVNWDG